MTLGVRVLGVDPGEKRIGIAVSDPSGTLARPLTVLQHTSRADDAARIVDIAKTLDAALIVVGVPYGAGNEEGVAARRALRLVEAIRAISPIPVQTWDESGSTQQALANLRVVGVSRKKQRGVIDHHAAAVILQDFLDSRARLPGLGVSPNQNVE